jgi:hypothetical protein
MHTSVVACLPHHAMVYSTTKQHYMPTAHTHTPIPLQITPLFPQIAVVIEGSIDKVVNLLVPILQGAFEGVDHLPDFTLITLADLSPAEAHQQQEGAQDRLLGMCVDVRCHRWPRGPCSAASTRGY